jgi:hypothetical protein
MSGEVVPMLPAGSAEVLGAGVPLSTISHGPAALGAVVGSAPHAVRITTTPVSGAAALISDEIRITRR